MKKPLVHCRVCGEPIDREELTEGVDWIMPSKNFYYHKICYTDWQNKKNTLHSKADEYLWWCASWDFMKKELKTDLNAAKTSSQWKSFIKKGMTPKGIYFALSYFYDIQKNDPKNNKEGIGIVSYVYNDSREYWYEQEMNNNRICSQIEEQIRKSIDRERIEIMHKKKTKKKNKFSLEEISKLED